MTPRRPRLRSGPAGAETRGTCRIPCFVLSLNEVQRRPVWCVPQERGGPCHVRGSASGMDLGASPEDHVITNEFTFLMLPPQTDLTRQWARRLSDAVPGMKLVLAEDPATAAAAIVTADAAFGTLPADLLAKARRLRWLQAPQAAPPAGYYYSELVSHPLTVNNFREIYNDHISAHILAFVLAFARGLHVYIPQQLRREWKKPGEDKGVVPLPGATALIVGLGGIGAETARLLSAFGVRVLAVDARRTDQPEHVAE